MSFRKPCHMPFHKHIPPFTLTGVRHNQKVVIKVIFIPIEFLSRLNIINSNLKKKKKKKKTRKHTYPAIPY